RIGYVPAVIELLDLDADGIGFTGRVPALTESAEARFDDTNPANYELFGVRWAIMPDTQSPPPLGTLVDTVGRHRLQGMPGSGLLEVVNPTAPIRTDVRGIDAAVGEFLRSSMPTAGEYPLLDIDGHLTATPTAGPDTSGTIPGRVDVTYDLSSDG